MRTSNPAFSGQAFTAPSLPMGWDQAQQSVMTVNGTVNKTAILLLCVLATSFYSWNQAMTGSVGWLVLGGAIGGFIMAMVTIFKKEWAPVTAPIYGLLEGLFLGAISAMFNARYAGLPMQAVLLTFGTCLAMLLAYRSGLIRATEKFRVGVIAATGGIALVYFISIIIGFFGIQIPGIFGNGIIGIGFSLFVVGIAALNLILDFDFIEKGAAAGAPKYMEWYGAFGLMVTLIWLYLEMLRLLSKLQSRR